MGGLTWFTTAAIAVKGAGRGNALSADGVLLAISTGSQLFVRNNVTGVIRTFVLPWSASFYDVGGVSFARNGALVMFEVTLRSNSVSTIYSMWLPDDVYASRRCACMERTGR